MISSLALAVMLAANDAPVLQPDGGAVVLAEPKWKVEAVETCFAPKPPDGGTAEVEVYPSGCWSPTEDCISMARDRMRKRDELTKCRAEQVVLPPLEPSTGSWLLAVGVALTAGFVAGAVLTLKLTR